MEFSWPYSPIKDWNRLAIQHYSGNIEDKSKFFKKTEYLNYTPWYDTNLDVIPNISCSYEILKLIKARRVELDSKRLSFPNKVILLKGEEIDDKTKKLFTLYKNYLTKYLDIELCYLHRAENSATIIYNDPFSLEKFDIINLECHYLIIPINLLISIYEIKRCLGQEINQYISIHKALVSDALFSEAFSKMLDIQLLMENKGKFNKVECLTTIESVDYDTMLNEVLHGKNISMTRGKLTMYDCFILNQ